MIVARTLAAWFARIEAEWEMAPPDEVVAWAEPFADLRAAWTEAPGTDHLVALAGAFGAAERPVLVEARFAAWYAEDKILGGAAASADVAELASRARALLENDTASSGVVTQVWDEAQRIDRRACDAMPTSGPEARAERDRAWRAITDYVRAHAGVLLARGLPPAPVDDDDFGGDDAYGVAIDAITEELLGPCQALPEVRLLDAAVTATHLAHATCLVERAHAAVASAIAAWQRARVARRTITERPRLTASQRAQLLDAAHLDTARAWAGAAFAFALAADAHGQHRLAQPDVREDWTLGAIDAAVDAMIGRRPRHDAREETDRVILQMAGFASDKIARHQAGYVRSREHELWPGGAPPGGDSGGVRIAGAEGARSRPGGHLRLVHGGARRRGGGRGSSR